MQHSEAPWESKHDVMVVCGFSSVTNNVNAFFSEVSRFSDLMVYLVILMLGR